MLLIGCTVLLAVVLMLLTAIIVLFNYKLYRLFRIAQSKIFYNAFIRYLFQSTLKMQIASITTITLVAWDQGKNQILIAAAVIFIFSVMPFIFIGVLINNFNSLDKPSMLQKIGSMYYGLKTGKKWATVAYPFIFFFPKTNFCRDDFPNERPA